jgi:hypothetical protein
MAVELWQGAETMANEEAEGGGTRFEVSVASFELLFVSTSAPIVGKLFLFT